MIVEFKTEDYSIYVRRTYKKYQCKKFADNDDIYLMLDIFFLIVPYSYSPTSGKLTSFTSFSTTKTYSRFLLKTCGILAKGTFTLQGAGKCP